MRAVRYIYIIGIIIALVGLTACDGKGSQTQDDIPDRRIRNHSDTLALEARKTSDFNRVLAVVDSLVDAGEMSPIQAANYQCEAYFMLGQSEKSMDCLRRATADNNPPAEDFWVYINCGMHLAMLQDGLHDRDGAISTALRFIKELQQVKSPYRARALKSLYYFLGKTQMTLERHDEAAESFNEAYRWLKLNIEIDSTGGMMPNAMLTLENTASAYFGINQPDEAERWVNREHYLNGMTNMTELLDAQRQWQQALTSRNAANSEYLQAKTRYLILTGRREEVNHLPTLFGKEDSARTKN